MSKRLSTLPAAPATPVHFVPDGSGSGSGYGSIVMADNVAVVGTFPVTVSGDAVVHPRARLDAQAGPVNIGRRCIVAERAVVGGATGSPESTTAPEGSVTLADYVSVETGAAVAAGAVVGQGSVVQARSLVGAGAVIGRYCTLAPRTVIPPGTRVPDFTVVYGGGGQQRRDRRPAVAEARHREQARKIEVLRKLIASVPEKYAAAS
ncbi:transferase hexapeptide domain containing protein [Niveomyces insectorum RCEF 264]|uniref:Dynactin subunit 6 n=1 Tax=Niveomyces insectorum RCEF 264 TaxID=1081102 RepID=A0A167VJC7_9HYPO|nr:transferase hexapeptide domain containing protein [Niveomyces insectorum RCEF 264]